MAKYEIMLVVRGDIEQKQADETANELLKTLGDTKVEKLNLYEGLQQLAYEIKKNKYCYRYVYQFTTTNVETLNEYRRLALINKNVLRHIIINLENDYGYKATINPKKIERNAKKLQVYEKNQEEYAKKMAERQAAYEALKAQREAQGLPFVDRYRYRKQSA
ncbi:30S ribosomal protein S6 [Ureaplasma canigenitalium]|uniref:30S ribosomal protein S6 n=1 Tax=Ureaplasma canigenitalium TaxID=42092 RepID=UPI0004E181DC|nr:30S ribosomal protein S6 [Ureaplasma canigenitalium]